MMAGGAVIAVDMVVEVDIEGEVSEAAGLGAEDAGEGGCRKEGLHIAMGVESGVGYPSLHFNMTYAPKEQLLYASLSFT